MSRFYHTLLISLSILLAYIWASTPFLARYSLQAYAFATVLYFVIKRINNTQAKAWHILPTMASIEMVIATFAFLLVVADTGNLNSFLYPLTFVHLFFLVLSSHVSTAIIATMNIVLFYYALTPQVTSTEISHLLTIPIILIFFLFAKEEYHQVFKERLIIEKEEEELLEIKEKLTEVTHQRDELAEKLKI